MVSSLGVGVQAFFVEPGQALISDPTDIEKIGLATVKGTVYLVSNTVDGVFTVVSTFTRALGRGVGQLCMDDIFTHERLALQRQPRNSFEAAIRPLRDIFNGIYCAGFGLARVPARNYRIYGMKGLVTGTLKGIFGAPVKVFVGTLDAVTHTGDAVAQGKILCIKTITI